MAIFSIREQGDPVLREKASPVSKINQEIKNLAKNMSDTMYDAPGAGLAANQIGILKRVITYDIGDGLRVCINPEVIWASDECEEDEEGCLSFGGVRVLISRPIRVKVKAKDLNGNDVEITAEDLEARVLQHEIDHLNGVVILDRTAKREKRRALKSLRDSMIY